VCVVWACVRILPQNSELPCVFPALNVVIIRDKPHLKLGYLLFDDFDGHDDMHLTPSSYSSTLDMPPHIVTVNAAVAARSTACFCCYISKHFFCYNPLFTILLFYFLYMSTNTDPSTFFEILFLKVSNAIYVLERGGRCSCLRPCATRREVSVSIPGRFLGNFKVIRFLLSAFSSSGVHSTCIKK
jgi:hypothetical protein